MSENVFEGIAYLIGLLILFSAMQPVFQQIGEHEHPGYKSTIQNQNDTIQNLRDRVQTLQTQNENISQKYERLVKENVTKKDVEEIERELNQTSSEVKILNQKFETINQQFISSYQKTVNKYQLWMSVSLLSISFLAFDVLGGALFGRSFTDRVSTALSTAGGKIKERFSEKEKSESNVEYEDEGH